MWSLAFKLSVVFAILWCLYEVREITILINYPRLTKFLVHFYRIVIAFCIYRTVGALLEFFFPMRYAIFSLSSTVLFFVAFALITRYRRNRLIANWNNLPDHITNDKVYNEVTKDLKNITKDLTVLKSEPPN